MTIVFIIRIFLSHSTDDANSATVLLSSFSPNDILIVISHSGETRDACNIARLAQKLGIYVVAVTTFIASTLARNADIVLQTQTRESPVHKIAFTSRISQLASMDALFMTYFAMNQQECKNNINSISSNLQEIQ